MIVQHQVGTKFEVLFLAGLYMLYGLWHSFQGILLGTIVGVCKCVSLCTTCITDVSFVLPEADNKSLLVGFPKLGFSLAGCQNSGCAHVFCDCCSLLFFAAIYLVICVFSYDIAECG